MPVSTISRYPSAASCFVCRTASSGGSERTGPRAKGMMQ